MHYLRKEVKQLTKYCEGLGIKIIFVKKKNPTAEATWALDGSEITIYNSENKGPLDICLDLYHELSHHLSWVHSGRKGNMRLDYLMSKEQLTKNQRKEVYLSEKVDLETFMKVIHKEVGSKIPLKKIEDAIKFDLFNYRYWYLYNKWPNRAAQRAFRRKLKK